MRKKTYPITAINPCYECENLPLTAIDHGYERVQNIYFDLGYEGDNLQ